MYKIFATIIIGAMAYGECMVHYNRTACPGTARNGMSNQEISYKKCGGKKECTKQKPASSLEQCQAAALKACGNKRYSITKSKIVKATWNGAAIKDASGSEDFCANYANRATEYNRCNN
jgi:hypothetical protein